VDLEVLEALSWVEFVKFISWQVDLVEFLVLGYQFLFFCTDNLTLFSQLVPHQVLQLLPEVDLLRWCQVSLQITAK